MAEGDEPEKRCLILKLDVGNPGWNPLCSFVGNFAASFLCDDTLYMICMETCDEENLIVKKVLYLDEDEASVKTASFHNLPLFMDSFTVPQHIL